MKIAYLMHSDREYDEVIETINQLTKQGDHVFIMINDDDLRDKIVFVYADYLRVHVSRKQEYGQEGDLSLARGTIIQMKEAMELGGFDYFINLTDGMLPLKTRSEIVAFLEEHPNDYYYESSKSSEELIKKREKYYPFTNTLMFPTSKFMRGLSRGSAALFGLFGVKRKLEDDYRIGSPYFILRAETAKILTENFDYVSHSFKLCWYPEELYIPMMMHKFVYVNGKEDTHVNSDLRVIGPDGAWKESAGSKPLSEDLLKQHPEALFGGRITAADTLYIYNDYFDRYNQDIEDQQLQQKRDIDPNAIIDAFMQNKEKKDNEQQ